MNLNELYNKLGEHINYDSQAIIYAQDIDSGDTYEVIDTELDYETAPTKDGVFVIKIRFTLG